MTTRAVEDYLKCILVEEQGLDAGRVSTGRIAQSLGLAPGTVTAMLQALAEAGRVDYAPYGGVRLTADGRRQALHVLRRHRLIELFLVEVVGMDWGEVHEEAERLEHVVSERFVERMDVMLGHPQVDPHGDPIPTAQGHVETYDRESLLSCATSRPLQVCRVRDQSSEFLRLVEERGLMPGSQLEVAERNPAAETVLLRLLPEGDTVSLGYGAASKIQVSPTAAAVP
ncbi:MAG: metal-dependent transcriptional regulator [Acidobacteria bacterium]|nr:metal-dependent transcriptional regulator [Acidobacteriota bacterium]